MVLLSSLLGPAKPPVATQDEITSAGGLYRLVEYSGALVAESIGETHESLPIAEHERCLICLCDYEAADEVRILNKCKHVYHRECIDEVYIQIVLLLFKANLFLIVANNWTQFLSIMSGGRRLQF